MLELLFWFTGFIFNLITIIICRYRGTKLINSPPLNDIIHTYIPPIPYYIPDILLTIMGVIVVISHIMFVSPNLLDAIQIHGYILFTRSVTCQVTLYSTCMPDIYKTSNKFLKIYNFFFHGTHDLMFSGHTSLALTLQFIGNSIFIDTYFFNILSTIIGLTLIIARQHYTIDVIVAFFVFEFWKKYSSFYLI